MAASLISLILDGVLFVVDPFMGLFFFLTDLNARNLIDEETKPDRPLL